MAGKRETELRAELAGLAAQGDHLLLAELVARAEELARARHRAQSAAQLERMAAQEFRLARRRARQQWSADQIAAALEAASSSGQPRA